jgi:hypothetical protein
MSPGSAAGRACLWVAKQISWRGGLLRTAVDGSAR